MECHDRPDEEVTEERHGVDVEFLEMCTNIANLSKDMSLEDNRKIQQWLVKLQGTHPLVRNDYARCMVYQLSTEGALDVPFKELPEKYKELLPLIDAIHGPNPETPIIKRGFRAEKSAAPKKLTQKELMAKFGTDRVGIAKCLKEMKQSDITVQGLVAYVRKYTRDNASVMLDLMTKELVQFRDQVYEFYDQQLNAISSYLASKQLEINQSFADEEARLVAERDALVQKLREKCPDFDMGQYRQQNMISELQKRKLRKLRMEAVKMEEKNKEARHIVQDLRKLQRANQSDEEVARAEAAVEAERLAGLLGAETDDSLGLLPEELLRDVSLNASICSAAVCPARTVPDDEHE